MPSLAELHRLGRPAGPLERRLQRGLWPLRNAWVGLRRALRRAGIQLRSDPAPRPLRLHVGSGGHHLDGWVNLDIEPLEGVDVVLDVTRGIPYRSAAAVFAEHFLEHLEVDRAVAFLLDVHRALAPGGVLRLSTPNLEWVMATNYAAGEERDPVAVNRAFHAWGHRFLWDRRLLEEALLACGFINLQWAGYGASSRPELDGLEGHVEYGDSPELTHVLVVEAERGNPQSELLRGLIERLQRDLLHHVERAYSPSYWREAWWRERRGRRGGSRQARQGREQR